MEILTRRSRGPIPPRAIAIAVTHARGIHPLALLPWLVACLMLAAVSMLRANALPDRLAAERLGLERHALVRLDLSSTTRVVSAPLEIDGRRVTARLEPAALRSPGFRLLVANPDGSLHEQAAPPSHAWRGTIVEFPGSIVGGTIVDGALTAAIGLPDGRLFFVQPVRSVDARADRALHVVYEGNAVAADSGVCATHEAQVVVPLPSGSAPLAVMAPKVADLAIDADFEFYNLNGASVSATVDDIESVMSGVNVVYQRDCNLTHRLSAVIVRSTEPDPYDTTDPDALIDEMQAHWNAAQTGVPRDLAHLMTGKNIDGGTIGIASVGVVCSRTRAYGLSQSRFTSNFARRTALTAHELGHNWNADHCDGVTPCNIMCSSIDGCNGIGLPNFEPQGIQDITAFAATRTCLDSPAMAVDPVAAAGAVRLAPAQPSPFRGRTTLSFYLLKGGPVSLGIYDVSGHRLLELAGGDESAGWHTRVWNGLDRTGQPVGPGVFYARLAAAGQTSAQKLILIR